MTLPAGSNLTPGTTLYKYKLISLIGRGNFGDVWRATDIALKRTCAIKILNSAFSIDQRLKEAQIGNCLDHQNLVRVHYADVIVEHNLVIIVMDYLPNGSAEDKANSKKFIPLNEAISIIIDVLKGLDYLHANDYIHNDIKPANILFSSQGQAMLSDYGIAGVSTDGSPAVAPSSYRPHKAPEIDDTGHVSVSTDVFQVGMTLMRLVCGLNILVSKKHERSWEEYSADIANGKLISPADFPMHVPPKIRSIIRKATAPKPIDRFQSALDMRGHMEKLHFSGFWTIDVNDEMLGEDAKSYYRFEKLCSGDNKFTVNCWKTSKKSKHTQRVVRFCMKNVSPQDAEKTIGKFIKFVVMGC